MSNLNQKCICDEICLNRETLADIGHFTSCPEAEILNQVIEDGLKEFEESYDWITCDKEYGKCDCSAEVHGIKSEVITVKSFLHTFAEKIYKKAREEVIEEIESFKIPEIPENVEILPESQRIRKEWQNLLVKLIVKKIKGLKALKEK